MNWRVVFRPEIRNDIGEAYRWYEDQGTGLGREFVAEAIAVFESLAANPNLNSRRSRALNVRWRISRRFPYRVVYQVRESESLVLVIAVLHAARHDRHWQRRVE
ncbi:MAG TPA: type II toxin-antitoxin system RelE/ParE family toxin [Chthoniobacteraceae bacterium]|nr:type II toxin-antitoxin system RelE/ParE family toxin [Chthoniobacteraceae bacterium]